MEHVDLDGGIVCIRNVLSVAKCEVLMAYAESVAFEPDINAHSGIIDWVIVEDTDAKALQAFVPVDATETSTP